MGACETASQRRRILDAAVRVVGAAGYPGASATRISAAAAVSRPTFYEHFRNRDDCFFHCCQEAVDGLIETVRVRVQGLGPDATPWSLFEVLLDELQADQDRARLVLLESPGGPQAARREYERLLEVLGSGLRSLADPSRSRGGQLWLAPTALLGGITGIATVRLLLRRPGELTLLRDDLACWARSYLSDAADPPPTPAEWARLSRRVGVSRRSPMPHDPSEGARGTSRRERLIEAAAELTAAHGYRGLRVADIAAAVGIRRASFYAEFCDKADVFRALQVANLQRSIAAAAGQFSLGDEWPDRVWRGLRALLAYLAEHPAETQAVKVEIYAAGEEEMRIAQRSRAAFTLFLEEGYRLPAGASLPQLASEAIAAAIYALMRHEIVNGQTRRLPQILPQTAFVALAPFLGPRQAYDFVELKVQEGERGPRRGHPNPFALAG